MLLDVADDSCGTSHILCSVHAFAMVDNTYAAHRVHVYADFYDSSDPAQLYMYYLTRTVLLYC